MSDVEYPGDDPRGQNYWDDLTDELAREFGDGPMRVEQGDPNHNPAFDEPEEVYGAEEPDDGYDDLTFCTVCGYELDMFGVCRNGDCEESPEWHKYW